MNPWQMAQQIKHELETVVWGTAGDVVFGNQGSVVVFEGAPNADQIPNAMPAALVVISDYDSDDDHPDVLTQQFQVMIAAEVAGDPMGEFAIIGGSAPDLDESSGRGTHELAERVRHALNTLTGADGAKVILSGGGGGGAAPLGDGRHVAWTQCNFEAVCTSQLAYAAPQHLAYAGAGGGHAWTWEGAHCSDRFDFVRYQIEGNASGTPPETLGSGDIVFYQGTAATSAFVGSSGYGYTVFAEYSARGYAGGSAEGSSVKETGTTVVVA